MAVTSQPELYVRAKLAEVERIQYSADRRAWTQPEPQRKQPSSLRLRERLGLATIRVGAKIAGPGLPSLGAVPSPSEVQSPV